MQKKFAGIYTGKFKVGERVHSGTTYPTGIYYGTILGVLEGQDFNNAYTVHWDGDYYDDGTPSVCYMSEDNLVKAN